MGPGTYGQRDGRRLLFVGKKGHVNAWISLPARASSSHRSATEMAKPRHVQAWSNMTNLADRLEAGNGGSPDEVLGSFYRLGGRRGLQLYPAQEEALLSVLAGDHVIVATPTGSGKSLVALGAHLAMLATGRRSWYSAPIKALVSEKFFDLCAQLGTANVGMLTGDASINPDAPVICCTAEVLANLALRYGENAPVDQVVMDEFHFYADPDRGWAWQVPLIELRKSQFILMSATLGDVSRFVRDFERRTGRPTTRGQLARSPGATGLPLRPHPRARHHQRTDTRGLAPIYAVHFTQKAAVERAQALTSAQVATRAERDADRSCNFACSLRHRLRPHSLAAPAPRHWRPPRRHAPEVPAFSGAALPGRAAESGVRH